MTDIVFSNVTKAFDREVLKNMSAVFPAGCVTVLTGASGIGKTTVLRLLLGMIKPDAGTILGRDNVRFSVVFQENRLINDADFYTNLRLVCHKDISDAEIERHAAALGLSESIRRPARLMSGGMQRRTSIARAMIYGGDAFLLDEPFKGLDNANRAAAAEYIRACTAGKTVVLVTHDPAESELLHASVEVKMLPIGGES